LSAPFTDDPVKNGIITFPGSKKPVEIVNSSSSLRKSYVDFIKNSVAYIPQRTDSFHPAIPVRRQMYDYYKIIMPDNKMPGETDFNNLLKRLSKYAGWDNVEAPSFRKKTKLNKIRQFLGIREPLLIQDKKLYRDINSNDPYTIVDTGKSGNRKTYEDQFSTGQKQRLFILLGLLRFYLAKNPVFIADEFLVNFTYHEANKVLQNIIDFFYLDEFAGKNKIAVFILHDLSFEFLKNLPKEKDINLFVIEKDDHVKTVQKLIKHEMPLYDFFHKELPEGNVFYRFMDSYKPQALPEEKIKGINPNSINAKNWRIDIDLKDSVPKGIYSDLKFTINSGRFIVLTGFSGCGKSTFCNQFLSQGIMDKKSFRYFPSQMLASISEDSQIGIKQDLSIIYDYYNKLEDLNKHRKKLAEIFRDVRLVEGDLSDEYLDQKIFNLSGGQLQRYWFARLLLDLNLDETDSEFIVLDESIASLDCITKNEIIFMLLKNILSDRGMTVVLVSHDLRDISVIYESLKELLKDKPGKLEEIFEHYEMFNGAINQVVIPFIEYCGNLEKKQPNEYILKSDGKRHLLRIEEEGNAGGVKL
jgi:putative ABC transport system ATP-binding protein